MTEALLQTTKQNTAIENKNNRASNRAETIKKRKKKAKHKK